VADLLQLGERAVAPHNPLQHDFFQAPERRLSNDPATASIPVLAVSADATRARVERVLTGGARAFITKPLDVERFLALVDDALREKVGV